MQPFKNIIEAPEAVKTRAKIDLGKQRNRKPKYENKHFDDFNFTAGFVQDTGICRKN